MEQAEGIYSASNNEVGGFWMFARADLHEELAEQRFPLRQIRRRRWQPSEHRSERSK